MSTGPARQPAPSPDDDLTQAVLGVLRSTGLTAVGIAPVETFEGTYGDLLTRRRAGLHGGMAFTYRNPARSTDPGRILGGARSLVVGAHDYFGTAPRRHAAAGLGVGRVARYAWSDSYAALSAKLSQGVAVLEEAGHRAVVVADQNALVDREAARRAGIGWYGHNANLLIAGQGSWCVLGSIVTDAFLTPSSPVESYGCGTCTRCVDGCPTGAIVGLGVVDARRCLSWLLQAPGSFPRELRVALDDRMYGCDDCQEVCPPNLVRGRRASPVGADASSTVDLAAFLVDDDAAVMRAAGRWYVAERAPRYLRRNALIVLGNRGDPSDPSVIAAVQWGIAHTDPVVRAHAVWAAARLGRPDLADALDATEADPMVREELDLRGEVEARHAGQAS
ncbi:MAG: tRNA epoxyqueuosine(34) reductase QueG [Acidimicrobiales bacterium]